MVASCRPLDHQPQFNTHTHTHSFSLFKRIVSRCNPKMSSNKATQVDSLDDLIRILRQTFQSDEVDVDFVQELMSNYVSKPAEWRKYAVYDPHRYTRNLVDTGNGKYNLMLLCWSQGQGSAIHDHSGAHCFMKMLAGNLTEVKFDWPEGMKSGDDSPNSHSSWAEHTQMKVISETTLNVNQVAYINDSIGLHRMENRDHCNPAVTLHLYTPPYSSCRTFDERTGRTSQVKVTFTSKFGKRTPYKVKTCYDKEKRFLQYESIN